jgi:hypothetical protein
VTPHTTWEAAKILTCEFHGGNLDPGIHRLLFRGRERRPDETMAALGVKPGVKLMLLETEVGLCAS